MSSKVFFCCFDHVLTVNAAAARDQSDEHSTRTGMIINL